jgi:hypothetical protein
MTNVSTEAYAQISPWTLPEGNFVGVEPRPDQQENIYLWHSLANFWFKFLKNRVGNLQ